MALDRNESKKLRLEENIPEPISPIVSYGSVVLFSLLLILAGMNISSVAPFFPTEARERNISVPTTGIIVASLQISQGFFGFLFLFTVSDKQKIWFAYVGFVLSGLMCVIFSLSYHFNSKHLFVLWCSVTRILIGMGGACKWATSAPILIPLFPNKAGIIFSTLEVSANFGLMIGPPLSSWLYSLGGYKFPFIVMGATELFVGFLCFVATRSLQNRLPRQSSQQRQETEFSLKPALRFLSLPGVWAITLPFMVVLAQLGFLSVTLAPHLLDTFNIDGTKSGTIFLIHASMSTLTCFLYGYLLDKGYAKITFFICLALTSLGYFVLALPFVGFDHPKLTLYAGMLMDLIQYIIPLWYL